MVGHRDMSVALVLTGNFAEPFYTRIGRLALYDPVEDRPLATRFVQKLRVAVLPFRSLALWALGYPEAPLAGSNKRSVRRVRPASPAH